MSLQNKYFKIFLKNDNISFRKKKIKLIKLNKRFNILIKKENFNINFFALILNFLFIFLANNKNFTTFLTK